MCESRGHEPKRTYLIPQSQATKMRKHTIITHAHINSSGCNQHTHMYAHSFGFLLTRAQGGMSWFHSHQAPWPWDKPPEAPTTMNTSVVHLPSTIKFLSRITAADHQISQKELCWELEQLFWGMPCFDHDSSFEGGRLTESELSDVFLPDSAPGEGKTVPFCFKSTPANLCFSTPWYR